MKMTTTYFPQSPPYSKGFDCLFNLMKRNTTRLTSLDPGNYFIFDVMYELLPIISYDILILFVVAITNFEVFFKLSKNH